MKKIILTFISLCFSLSSLAADRLVSSFNDDGAGTLRRVIMSACQMAGDDTIRFVGSNRGRIILQPLSSIEIPSNCQGSIFLESHEEQNTIFDGSLLEDDFFFRIESDSNTLSGFYFQNFSSIPIQVSGTENLIEDNSFSNNQVSSIFIDGNHNELSHNRFYANLETPLIISGNQNQMTHNIVSGNESNGVEIVGDQNTLFSNRIGDSNNCEPLRYPSQILSEYPQLIRNQKPFIPILPNKVSTFQNQGGDASVSPFSLAERPSIIPLQVQQFPNFIPKASSKEYHDFSWNHLVFLIEDIECGNEGVGILIRGNRNTIGTRESDGNQIRFNESGGIYLFNEAQENSFIANQIDSNTGPGIRLERRANNSKRAPYLSDVKPDRDISEDGSYRYRFQVESDLGDQVYLYLRAIGDLEEGEFESDGSLYLSSFLMNSSSQEYYLDDGRLPPGSELMALSCDRVGNCSEFSNLIYLPWDSDHDTILDHLEDRNKDFALDEGESDPLLMDTDGDGLSDNLEDRNLNGEVDEGETDPSKIDTDGDGLSDYIETGGDGRFDEDQRDTNPLVDDTDGDGLLDGEEDLNRNGILNPGESDPLN